MTVSQNQHDAFICHECDLLNDSSLALTTPNCACLKDQKSINRNQCLAKQFKIKNRFVKMFM